MLRLLLIALVCCSSKSPAPGLPEKPIDDTAVRVRIAHAEARRGGGIAELVELAKHGPKHARLLALRGLGRIGGATALAALRAALDDRDREVVAAAAAGIGLTASLDEEDLKITDALLAAQRTHDHPAILEALGRAGDATAQPLLAQLAPSNAHAAIALGRHGRRKIALSAEARDALARATAHNDVGVRFAATWALTREHITKFDDPAIASANAALSARIADPDPEVRAQAVMAFARRKQVKAAQPAIEQALIDKDWRVAVEAVRALAGDDVRAAVVTGAIRNGNPHVAHEVLRGAIGKQDRSVEPLLQHVLPDTRATWAWLVGVAAQPPPKGQRLRHVMAASIVDWIKAKTGTLGERRAALQALLVDDDVRMRASGMSVLAAMWPDGDARDHEHAIKTVTAAIAAKDPMLAGSAIEAADELYEIAAEHRPALAAAIVQRADGEKDVELATALYGVIGKRGIGAGAPACKQGLQGHPVLVKAAHECSKKLGEPAPALTDPPEAKLPIADVTQVIGKRVTWRVQTTKGELAIQLRPDVAPWAVATIVMLTRRGYYDGLEFHRVVPNFVVQGGDPTESGWGGPGFMIPAEPGSTLDGDGFVAGGVGIADAGRDSGGSQWFVMHSRAPHLDGRYTWVGAVSEGKSADRLLIGDEVTKATIEIADR